MGCMEKRVDPTDGYTQGKTYLYLAGENPIGANCLFDCDAETLLFDKKINFSSVLNRGLDRAFVGASKRGVNGLYDVGPNLWGWAKLLKLYRISGDYGWFIVVWSASDEV